LSIEKEYKTLQLLSEGDEGVFDEIFRTHYKYLVTIAYGYTKNYELSKDLAQEVLMDLWKRRTTIRIQTGLRPFLKRAVINQSLSAFKNKSNQPTDSTDQLSLGSSDNAQQAIEYNELNSKIQNIISNLPPKCREIFEMSRYESLSHKEIAAKLDISTKTIENHITKALKSLREGLKNDHFISVSLILIAEYIGDKLPF